SGLQIDGRVHEVTTEPLVCRAVVVRVAGTKRTGAEAVHLARSSRSVCDGESIAAGGANRDRGIEGRGDDRVLAAESKSEFACRSDRSVPRGAGAWDVFVFPAVGDGDVSARAAKQARIAAGERKGSDGNRGVPASGPGTNVAVQLADGIRADVATEGGSRSGKGEFVLLRPPVGREPGPISCGRDFAGGSGPAGIAARAVRIGLANGGSGAAHSEDPVARLAE